MFWRSGWGGTGLGYGAGHGGYGAGHGGYGAGYGGYGSGYNGGSGYHGGGGYGGGAYGGGADCGTACCAGTAACLGCGPDCGAGCAQGSGCGGGGGGSILSYVGPGGDYVQETSYKYVGAGAGEFGVVRIPGRGLNCCLCLLIPLGLTLLLLPFLLWSLMGVTSTTTTTTTISIVTTPGMEMPPIFIPPEPAGMELPPTPAPTKKTTTEKTTTEKTTPPPPPPPPPPEPTTTEKKIDCAEGDAASWDAPKKVYCCLQNGKGCPTAPPPPETSPAPPPVVSSSMVPPPPPPSTTTPCPIDCNSGYNDLDPLQWVRGWSGEKKIYCCKTANKGCPSELPPPSGLPPDTDAPPPEPDNSVYDCDAGYHHCMHCLVESWSPNKIEYCCKNFHKGCKGEEPE